MLTLPKPYPYHISEFNVHMLIYYQSDYTYQATQCASFETIHNKQPSPDS